MSEKKYTQLDYKSRCIIEHLLNKKTPISEIAEAVGVSRQTIYREVARNSKTIAARDATHAKPSCVHWLECYRNKGKKAAVCPTDCPRYEKGFACPKLSSPHKTCSDFLVYVANHPGCPITQLDTVIGKSEWPMKSVLTIHVVRQHLQLGRMLESHCKEQVNAKMREILAALKKKQDETGVAVFDQFASCVIADNGIEFDDLIDLEDEFPGLHVYYTRAYASSDKAECERNHVLVRYIRYKGISWSDVDEEALKKLFDNINSYPRKSLGYEKPYRKVVEGIGREFVEAVGAKEVDVDDVNLRPDLLKK